MGCQKISLKLFDNLDKDMSVGVYVFLSKYRSVLHLDEDRIDIFIAFQPFFLKYLHEKVTSVDGNNFSKMFYQITNDMMLVKYLEEKSIISMFNPKLNIK